MNTSTNKAALHMIKEQYQASEESPSIPRRASLSRTIQASIGTRGGDRGCRLIRLDTERATVAQDAAALGEHCKHVWLRLRAEGKEELSVLAQVTAMRPLGESVLVDLSFKYIWPRFKAALGSLVALEP